MSVEIQLHPAAVAEAAAARRWYTKRDARAGESFLAALDDGIARIAEAPDRWPTYAHGTRRLLLRRFPFSVIYRASAGTVLVVAIAHQRQRPGYWSAR